VKQENALTETEVHVEHAHETESVAEAVADEVKEVLEEARVTEERVESIREVESAIEEIETKAEVHQHSEYSPMGHTHPEQDHNERIATLESRIEQIEHGLAEEVEEPVVEEIEPTEEPREAPPERKRRYSFGRR
jgi:hypothetical protein